jgi:hypothetical protein
VTAGRISVHPDLRDAQVRRAQARGRSQNPAILEQLKVSQ